MLSRDIFTLHRISMKYLYDKFRSSVIVTDKSKYGVNSVGCLSYSDGYGLVITEDLRIKELPDKFFPQGLLFEIGDRLKQISLKETTGQCQR